MNVQRLTLDLDKSSVPRGRVTIAQCDHDGTTVEAEIYDNGIALDTSGLSAYLVMRLPDGRHYYRVSATLDGHVATAIVDEAYAATATGTTEIAYFELVGSGEVVYSTSRFGVRVLPSATADATVPETWDGEVERLIQQLDEMAESSRVIIDELTTLEETVGAAERGRVSAESGRVSAETARANAETARRNAETARANAEQGRVSAEQGRVAAESSRASEFSTFKAESQAATSAANTAAENADAAATSANTAANEANAAAANANATADGVESRVQEMAQDAAETATADAEQRIQDAIEAMGDISELAVPLMSADVRGGAKLEEHGGLVLRDEKLGIGSLVQESDGAVRGGLAEVTAKCHAEQDGTPTPDSPVEIQVVRGRNLLNYDEWKNSAAFHGTAIWENNGVTLTATVDDCYTAWQIDGTTPITTRVSVSEGDVVTLSWKADSDANGQCYIFGNGDASLMVKANNASAKSVSYTVPSGVTFVTFRLGVLSAGTTIRYSDVQISLGSTPQPYVPYGHVGMEVRDPDTDELISCTALPLPSRGWVAGLPDGTADVLTLDGAGKVTWELKDDEVTFDGSSDESWYGHTKSCTVTVTPKARPIAGSDVAELLCTHFIKSTPSLVDGGNLGISQWTSGERFWFSDGTGSMTLDAWKTWLSTHPVTVLYPLATPVIEELGYIDPPEIPSEAIVSIQELDALGVRYFVDDSVGILARQWAARLESQLGDAIVELAARVAELES